MIYDRPYMRREVYQEKRPLSVILIIVNAICFLLQSICEYYRVFPVREYFYLSLRGLESGYVWQLITFQFLHGDLFHLLINLFVLYLFGRVMEDTIGRSRFLKLYFLSGVFGGILQILAGFVIRPLYGSAVVGASAGVFGLVAAFAAMFPEERLTTLIAFIIPVTMRAKYLLLIELLITLYGLIFPFSNVAHAAHLGGIITGVVFVKWDSVVKPFFNSLIPKKRPRIIVQPSKVIHKSVTLKTNEVGIDDDLPPEEFIRREVDPILDKIAEKGIQSLTERERKILEKARHIIDKR